MLKSIILVVVIAVLAGAVVFSCASRTSKNKTYLGKPDVVVGVRENDPEMQEAIATAKKTFPKFVEHWKDPKARYSVKFAVPTHNGGIEHIWFNPERIEGDDIEAVCANDPEGVPGLKDGDKRRLKTSDISDWMIILDGKCYGAYTTRVLAKRDPNQRPPFEYAEF